MIDRAVQSEELAEADMLRCAQPCSAVAMRLVAITASTCELQAEDRSVVNMAVVGACQAIRFPTAGQV
jgi:hypothetical protein